MKAIKLLSVCVSVCSLTAPISLLADSTYGRLVKTLQKRGHGALVDELYKTTSTQRLAADFDELHERLMAELIRQN